ncbi:NTPase/HAM1 domain protein [Metarhizium robertsii]|uniref:XTP/dITP diphosphatase n=2 Tax=Metarhizium robertsii TaxID=568076 RepID=E9F6S1_METRA|nr:Ham1-like protein [Metarhizium robertsii ARSEF 23]EFY96473.1 Ham1-like protein [Metarhizium robertsii ARSEF 23]EXU98091.1 NTPase/HAM1 domain protein [Metarhizium robertsii]
MDHTTITFVTENVNKVADVAGILGQIGIVVQQHAVELSELQGTSANIVIDKCRNAAKIVGGPVLVEDTSLCFKAIGDLPGPYMLVETPPSSAPVSKWFLEALGPQRLHLLLAGFSDYRAQAVSTIGYSQGPGHVPILFQGRADGTIVPARGSVNFGWHCCFEYGSTNLTFAEMGDQEKHKVSHLGKALDRFIAWLLTGSNPALEVQKNLLNA